MVLAVPPCRANDTSRSRRIAMDEFAPSLPDTPQPAAAQGAGFAPAAFAAIDLGTNNCRLLVGAPTSDGFRVLDSFSRAVRLGEGLDESGVLGEAAMDRAIAALQSCSQRLARRPIRAVRAVATEACRRAANGPAFLARVRAETGLVIGTINPPRMTCGMRAIGVSAIAASLDSTIVDNSSPSALATSAVATSEASICPKACPPPGKPRPKNTMLSSMLHCTMQKNASRMYFEKT